MYRLYIDETGNADLKASQRDPNHRFLSLSGVILDADYARRVAFPQLESIKEDLLGSHPDEPIILHRKDVISRNWPFHALRNTDIEKQFNDRLLAYLIGLEFIAITVVIDKREHLEKYTVWRHDPYHYCLEILLERFVYLMRERSSSGDLMAEVRGGKPDRRLERSYAGFYANGTSYVRAALMRRHLSSSSIKMRPKAANVTGLQIADLIAAPSAQYVRSIYNRDPTPTRFGAKIVSILTAEKYHRDYRGRIERYGIKWLP